MQLDYILINKLLTMDLKVYSNIVYTLACIQLIYP